MDEPKTTRKKSATITGAPQRKSAAIVPKRKNVKNVEKRDTLEPVEATFKQITKIAMDGHNTRSMAYLMGVTLETFDSFRLDYEEEVTAAIEEGRMLDNIECTTWLRTAAKNCNNFPAYKYYVESVHGQGRGADAPTSMTFTMIDPEDPDITGED